jgi:hypothetical protein
MFAVLTADTLKKIALAIIFTLKLGKLITM